MNVITDDLQHCRKIKGHNTSGKMKCLHELSVKNDFSTCLGWISPILISEIVADILCSVSKAWVLSENACAVISTDL